MESPAPSHPSSVSFLVYAGLILMGVLGASAVLRSQSAVLETKSVTDRETMVRTQIEARGIRNLRLLQALRKIERERFMPPSVRHLAYQDSALPIGHEQTISQPYIVAVMTELLDPRETDRVLEIGTGSGYQAAVLAELVKEVYSVEIVRALGEEARERLRDLGYANVQVRIGDGYQGWPEEAPFDKIIVTAAPEKIPQPLLDQLKEGGRMVIPVGDTTQDLMLLTKDKNGIQKKEVFPVRFVPMTGEAQKK